MAEKLVENWFPQKDGMRVS